MNACESRNIKLGDLAYLTDAEFLKIILSSADVFPGLYRFDPSYNDAVSKENFLSLMDFLEITHLCPSGSSKWSRKEWLSAHKIISAQSYGLGGRNFDRGKEEQSVQKLMADKYSAWTEKADSLSLCVIDNRKPVQEICLDKTYYMMGSLIRFSATMVKVSYDHFSGKSALELAVSAEEALDYIGKIFSHQSISKLFWRAEIVGQLSDLGLSEPRLNFREELIGEVFSEFDPGSPIFGTVNYPNFILPIRLAKLIGISRVNKLSS